MKSEIAHTRDGAQTVTVDGKYLHSRYAPVREAERLVRNYTPPPTSTILLVIGEGIPYFSTAIAESYPELTVHAITIGARATSDSPFPNFAEIALPGPPQGSLRRYVRSNIHPLFAGRIDAFLWPNAETCIPEWVDSAREELLAGLDDLRSQLATTASFGKLWIKNALRRSVGAETRRSMEIRAPYVVAVAGGPGAEAGIDRLSETVGPELLIAAASSAVPAVVHRGYNPAIVFHTDAGFWAQRYRIDRSNRYHHTPITVVSLRSSMKPGSAVANDGDLLVRHGWLGDSLAPDAEQWPLVPEYPTVAGTMLAFLRQATDASTAIGLLGFDLCSYDVLTHSRPHASDRYIDLRSSRLQPELSIRAGRARLFDAPAVMRWSDDTRAFQSESLAAFREPLTRLIDEIARDRPITHLAPSPVWGDDGARSNTPAPDIARRATNDPGTAESVKSRSIDRPPRTVRVEHARSTLQHWRSVLRSAEWSRDYADLLLHIAPVSTLKAVQHARSWDETLAEADSWLATLVETIGTPPR